jgi:DNA (cytosine-5)-methyltransferase 1
MTAYYNEHDPYAAQWLRNLIDAGHIAPGDVDERSITEVQAGDLKSYTQCHFFAGIAVWSHALRRAGWPDDRSVWTGSCPCQPFSQAGKQKGFDDARHLWPVWFRLIEECRPAIVLGEQVASALDWLDLVQTDLEAADYAFGASDLCAAGFGGAHIRQRLYYVGLGIPDSSGPLARQRRPEAARHGGSAVAAERAVGLAHASDERRQQDPGGSSADEEADGRARRLGGEPDSDNLAASHGAGGRLAEADSGQCRRLPDGEGRLLDGAQAGRQQGDGEPAAGSELLGLAHHHHQGPQRRPGVPERGDERAAGPGGLETEPRPAHAPLLGREAVDWLFCRDGKWRPVSPGTLPLAHASAGRVGRLRAYGNSLDDETATQFLGAVIEAAALVDDAAGLL